jgi:acyl-CoA reductase-like NAD-dependent aldehyde dehydrogenase
MRDSGFGREHGDVAIENFTEPKAVWINTGDESVRAAE